MQGKHYAAAAAAAISNEDRELRREGQEDRSVQNAKGGLERAQVDQALQEGKVNAVCIAMRAAVEGRMQGLRQVGTGEGV
jgi:hypothetical protein